MRAINLFYLAQAQGIDQFAQYENYLSQRDDEHKIRAHEVVSLVLFIQHMRNCGLVIGDFDGFFYEYKIPQIGKEFDLLKICAHGILNIELKSCSVSIEKIEKQLIKNEYYLRNFGRKMYLIEYIPSTHEVYILNDRNKAETFSEDELAKVIREFSVQFYPETRNLFRVSDYLVSPLNTPIRFLKGEYFLTQQQDAIKEEIITAIIDGKPFQFFCIRGAAGTGKTLLLYDIAKECSKIGSCCIIHSGNLSEGHYVINRKMANLTIIAAKELRYEFDLSEHKFIFVDEAHRIYSSMFSKIVSSASHCGSICVFCCDPRQVLSKSEHYRAIPTKIEALPNVKIYELTGRIRTNQKLADFIKALFDKSHRLIFSVNECVELLYSESTEDAKETLKNCANQGYVFIHFTPSRYISDSIDDFEGDHCTHAVLGQEFDKVVIILDHHFHYNSEDRLIAEHHPNPDYLFRQLLFQGVTRVREKLCLVIVDNRTLFSDILSILK